MFLCRMRHEEVLQVIRVTLQSPDEPPYVQGDGALVALRNFEYPVGEMVQFDRRGHLITRLTTTVKVVYTVNEDGDYEVITSFPLISRRAREVRIIFPNCKIWHFSMISIMILIYLFTYFAINLIDIHYFQILPSA